MKYKLEIEIKEPQFRPRCNGCDLCIYDQSEVYCAPTGESARVKYELEGSLESACYQLLDKCPLEVIA